MRATCCWAVSSLLALSSGCAGRSLLGDDGAVAGCTTDVECKGARVCEDGLCVSNEAPSPPRPPSPSPSAAAGGGASVGTCSVEPCSSMPPGRAPPSPDPGEEQPAPPGVPNPDEMDDPSPELTLTRHLPGTMALVSDPLRERFYAVLHSTAPKSPNSLVTLDAIEGTIIDSVSIGSDPDTLAISDDGSTLWVGLHGALAVREVDLTGDVPVPGQQFALPAVDFGDLGAAGPMVILPGTTGSLAVSLHRDDISPSFVGVVLLDDGVPRPGRTGGHTGASRLTAGPSGYLFGFNNLHTGYGVYTLRVEPGGLSQVEHQGLVSGFDTDISYREGFLFASSGEVIDVSDPDAPARAGRFPVSGPVLADASSKEVWMLTGASLFEPLPLALSELDFATFTLRSSRRLGDGIGAPRQLVRSPSGVFAFVGDSSGVRSGVTEVEGPGVYLVSVLADN